MVPIDPDEQEDRSGLGSPLDPHVKGGKGPNPSHTQAMMNAVTWLLVFSSFVYLWNSLTESTTQKISYSQFKRELVKDNVQLVNIKGSQVEGVFRSPIGGEPDQLQGQFRTLIPSMGDDQLLRALEENEVDIESIGVEPPMWISIVLNIAPWFILIAFFIYSGKIMRNNLMGRSGMGFANSKAKRFEATAVTTRYSEVAGLESAKRDLQEIIGYLKDPQHYRDLGAKMPKGILMMGPPGCGKTLLARATAGEAGVPFFSVSGSEFIEMFVGVGASRVRDMFSNARKNAPALIFIDEIDSVGRIRGTGLGGGNDEREQTLNQILAEMDGFSPDEAVVVLAATNRPDVLDPALLRPGRFDRKLLLDLPDREAREAILGVHCKKVPLAEDVDLAMLASSTVGFSGADLANLVNEAALRAARTNATSVTASDFSEARDKIVMGAERGGMLTDEEKERIAYHEAGHAITAALSPNADPVNKVSIIPRGRSLGMTEQIPSEDHRNYTQQYLTERLAILLGGRVAEQLQFGDISTGAADDLKNATQLARQMTTEWGMSERIGPVYCATGEEHPFLGREMAEGKHYSEYAAKLVDEEVAALIGQCEALCLERLSAHHDALSRLAQGLLEHETLNKQEIQRLIANIQ